MHSAVGFRNFCKGDESLKDEKSSGQPSEVDNDNWEPSSKLILLRLYKNSTSTILWSFGIWSKLEGWKSSITGCLMSWPQIKKIIILKCCLLLFCTTTKNHFSIRLWHATKSGFYTAAGNDQLSGWTKKKLQSTSQSLYILIYKGRGGSVVRQKASDSYIAGISIEHIWH